MTDRQQSAFFLAIIFFFASGLGLLIYKQYDEYYQQKVVIDLEAASTASPSNKVVTTSKQVAGWKTYKNTKYGFELQYPDNWMILNELAAKNNWEVSIFKAKWLHSIEPGGLYISSSTLTPHAIEAKSFQILNGDETEDIHLILNGRGIFASCDLYSGLYDAGEINICNKILSTFKFIK